MAYGRTRSRLGRGILALGVCTALLTVTSIWRWVAWDNAAGWGANLYGGTVTIRHVNSPVISAKRLVGTLPLGFSQGQVSPVQDRWTWWFFEEAMSTSRGIFKVRNINGFGVVATYVTVLFWPVPPLLLVTGLVFWRWGRRFTRRHARGLCLKCGYSLAGLAPAARCPECGHKRTDSKPPLHAVKQTETPLVS